MKKAIYQNITIIAFDADDTLWDNESHFRRVEKEFSLLFAKYGTQDEIITKLSDIEIGNIPQYGYGSKSFMLSLIEAAIEITNRQLSALELEQILQMGQSILSHSITLLPNVKEVLQKLQGN